MKRKAIPKAAEWREPLVAMSFDEAEAVQHEVAAEEVVKAASLLLNVLKLGRQAVAAGKVKPVADVLARLRTKRPSA